MPDDLDLAFHGNLQGTWKLDADATADSRKQGCAGLNQEAAIGDVSSQTRQGCAAGADRHFELDLEADRYSGFEVEKVDERFLEAEPVTGMAAMNSLTHLHG